MWKKCFCIVLKIQQNLNFLFLSHCAYLFKNWPSQFLSHLESVLYWGAQFSSLKKPKQKPDLQFGAGKFKFCCMLRIIHKCFFHWATFTCILKRFYFLIFSINVNDIKSRNKMQLRLQKEFNSNVPPHFPKLCQRPRECWSKANTMGTKPFWSWIFILSKYFSNV